MSTGKNEERKKGRSKQGKLGEREENKNEYLQRPFRNRSPITSPINNDCAIEAERLPISTHH